MKYRKLSFISIVFVFAITTIFLGFNSCSFKNPKKNKLTVVFYNVENLFDLNDDPEKDDEEFMPDGAKEWTEERYLKKIDDVALVLSSINENDLPEIIGLAEVENMKVLQDLIKTDKLKKGRYKIVHYESPDIRGIDCALIYRPKEFSVTESQPLRVHFVNEPDYKTRDILYVKGFTSGKEELHIFVTHWPSRLGGVTASEPYRIEVARILRTKIDSVQNENPDANIVVMGDLNDVPSNTSVNEVLGANKPGTENSKLINLMYPVHESKNGSYYFMGDLYMLDNIIVSPSLLDDKGFRCTDNQGNVFHQEWMEYKNREGFVLPNRTYSGPRYLGGISDHYPVYIELSR